MYKIRLKIEFLLKHIHTHIFLQYLRWKFNVYYDTYNGDNV